MKKKIILIGGPTGVGKTKLGILCANKFNGEILSADSVAIYKYLDIGSAKPDESEQKQAKHHLIDIVEPTQEFSVSDYVLKAKTIIDSLFSQGKLPIIVGGTGLYMKSLLFPYSLGKSEKNLEIREEYKKLAQDKGNQYVYELLKEIDPISASKIHPNDIKKVIRAIEIFKTTGNVKQNDEQLDSQYDYFLIFLNGDRKKIYDRINLRVDKMIDAGLEHEIADLIQNKGVTRDSQSMQGIGYKEWFNYFDKNASFEDVKESIKLNSRHYAKRQITWFKGMKNVKEYSFEDVDKILNDIEHFLKS